ncbi:MAG TPA: FtsX-like permease family protein, partial [Bryobacteraceae bacterium]|nr:FtsX-like permease family protein [Bryobacteraceae bacterium]
IQRAVHNTPGVRRVEGWIVTEGTLPAPNASAPVANHSTAGGTARSGGERFTVIALPAGTDLLNMEIIEGRALQPGDTDAIVLNNVLAAKDPRMKVGNTVTARVGPAELPWRVVGIAREAFSSAAAYIPLAYFEQLGGHQGMTNSIRLVLDKTDAASMNAVKAALDRALEREQVRAAGSKSKADNRFALDQHMLMIYIFLIVMSCIIGAVGGLGLMTTMSLNVLERRREMGVLRAIGAAPRVIWWIVAVEGIAIAVSSWAVAALAAWPISKAVGNALVHAINQSHLDFVFETNGLWIWLAASVLLGAAASFLPAWHASRCPVREAIGYE